VVDLLVVVVRIPLNIPHCHLADRHSQGDQQTAHEEQLDISIGSYHSSRDDCGDGDYEVDSD